MATRPSRSNSKQMRMGKMKLEAWAERAAYFTQHEEETFWGVLKQEAAREVERYLENPCVHGLKYVGRNNYPLAVRAAWAVLLALSVFGLVYLTVTQHTSYLNSRSNPTTTVVAETRVDSTNHPFPSVTVCPLGSIVKSQGLRFLERETGYTVENVSDTLMEVTGNFFKALQEFRFPLYSDPGQEEAQFRGFFDSFDVRELMLNALTAQATPPCESLIVQCFWNAEKFNCCEKFLLQETNWGFCYAFNSCTSLANKGDDCEPLLGVSEEETGLFFQTFPSHDVELVKLESLSRGINMVITNPYEIPIPSDGIYISELDSNIIKVAVRS